MTSFGLNRFAGVLNTKFGLFARTIEITHDHRANGPVERQPSAGANAVGGSHPDALHQVNEADCTEVDEQKKSGVGLFYFIGSYAIVKVGRASTMDAQS